MFFTGSRYEKLPTREATDAAGRVVRYVVPRAPATRPLQGYHSRVDGQRLDLIASHYLNDPSAFWVLCDANGTVVPDALATAVRVGIPVTGR
jgi:hypothetical protein